MIVNALLAAALAGALLVVTPSCFSCFGDGCEGTGSDAAQSSATGSIEDAGSDGAGGAKGDAGVGAGGGWARVSWAPCAIDVATDPSSVTAPLVWSACLDSIAGCEIASTNDAS